MLNYIAESDPRINPEAFSGVRVRRRKTKPFQLVACDPVATLSPAMRERHEALCDLIRQAQQEAPFEHAGDRWGPPVPQSAWCEAGGFALRTFQELIKVAPIRRYNCKIDGRKVTLLRVGEPGAESGRALAKAMDLIYRDKTGEARVSGNEFGMLCGIASDFPDGFELDVFKHAITHWPDFMDVVKFEVETALRLHRAGGDPFHPEVLANPIYTTARRYHGREQELREGRIYRRPFIPLLRAFWPVAVELLIDHRQRHGGTHPGHVWWRWNSRCADSVS